MATNQKLDKTNCYRVCRLLLDGGKQLLFNFLVETISPISLDVFLIANQTTIHALHTKFKPAISKSQWDILYPPSGGTDKQKWDITLTSCILTNCVSTLSFHQNKAIKDIRTLRNELHGHIGEFQMNQSEFIGAWTKVKQALQDGARDLLANPCSFDLQALVDDIENETIVSDDKLKQIQQIYNQWKSTDIAVLDAVHDLERDQKKGFTGIGTSLASQSEKLTGIDTSLVSQSDKLTGIGTSLASQSEKLTGIDTFLASQSEKLTGIDTSLVSQSEKLTGIDTSLVSQSEQLTGIDTSLVSQSEQLTGIDTSLASQSDKLTGIDTSLASQSEKLTGIDTSLASQSEKLTGIDTSLVSQSEKLTGIDDSLASQREQLIGIDTSLASQSENLTGIDTSLASQSEKLTGIDTSLASQSEKLTDIDTFLTSQSDKLTGIDTSLVSQIEKLTSIDTSLASQSEELSGIGTSLASQSDKLTSIDISLVSQSEQLTAQSEQLTGIDTSLASQSEQLTGIDTSLVTQSEQLTAQSDQLTGIDTSLASQSDKLTSIDTSLVSQSEQLTAQSDQLTGIDTSLASQSEELSGIGTSLASQSEKLTGIDTTLASQSEDIAVIKDYVKDIVQTQKRQNTGSDGYEDGLVTNRSRGVGGPGPKSDTGDGDNKGSEINKDLPAGMMYTPSQETEQQTENCLSQEYQDLQSDLIKYYKLSIIKTPTRVQTTYKETDIGNLYVAPDLVLVDHTVITNDKSNEKKVSLQDLFQEDKSCCQQIYVSGDAGMGKTSFCKHLVDNWCQAHSQEHASRNKHIMSNLKKFDFLFFVSLRDAKDMYEIKDMIVSQVLRHTKATDKVLDDLLRHNSKKCLIILDGLDEWTCHNKLPEYPGRNLLLNYTIMTLTRPWKLEAIRLKEKDIDQKIEIRGVQDVEEFGNKLVRIYNEQQNKVKKYEDFEIDLEEQSLYELRNTPILLKQLICLWFYDRPLGNTKTAVYANMVELLFEIGENRERNKNFVIVKCQSEMLNKQMPPCFKKLGRCKKYKTLLLLLGKLAFKTLFQDSEALNSETQGSVTQLVFDSSEATLHGVSETDIDICLKVGILTQSIVPDEVCEKRSMSFLHKTFHEFFAALYISINGSSVNNFKAVIGNKLRSTDDLFDIADMLRFLSGMCPCLMEKMSDCLTGAIGGMKEIIEYRYTLKNERKFWINEDRSKVERVQSMILSCCREGSDNDQDPLYLPVPDVIIGSEEYRGPLVEESCSTLAHCIQHYPSKLMSFNLLCNNAFDKLKDIVSVKCLNAKETRYHIELSTFTNLCSVRLGQGGLCSVMEQKVQITLGINENQLTSLSLENISSSNVLSTIKKATMLQSLKLVSIGCKDPTTASHCPFNLDLSEHKHLRNLVLQELSIKSVKLNSSLHYLMMTNVHTLNHDEICSLISGISNAHSAKVISLTSVHCRDHASGADCSYNINLSGHSSLKELYLKDISPGSVVMTSPDSCPPYRRIKMENIQTLTHDGICSLMSGISKAHSAEYITLTSVHCRDHAGGADCGYNINLSGHSSLKKLHLEDISPGSVVLTSPDSCLPYIKITMENIQTLTHDGMCSLMSVISKAHSVEYIKLTSVHCRDHAGGADCGYNIDLSGHSSLLFLDLEDISPGSVLMSSPDSCPPNIKITMKNIKSLTHDGICSLMSGISNAHSAKAISLTSVHCRDDGSGADCGYSINLSRHSLLLLLDLEDISPGSVVLSSPDSCPPYIDITMKNIKSLTHDGICSLMSGLSNAHSAEYINLTSVHCRDHASGADCGYSINLSRHSLLKNLHLEDISPGSLVMSSPDSCPPYSEITMENIQTLTHDGICSLMSGISNAHSAYNISLTSVHCRDHASGAECGYNIDLSGHSSLKSLHLEDVSPGSVVLSSPDSCPPYRWIKMKNVQTLTHDGICSLMSVISKAHSAYIISLTSVNCRDHASGAECGYNIDLSGHSSLYHLHLEDISPASVVMSSSDSCPPYREITMENIQTLTHGGICSLMSGISNAHSAEDIKLTSVHCRDHAVGADCGYNIDLSGHSSLKKLHLEDISPGSVVMSSPDSCPPYRRIRMKNIQTLTHEAMCSMMSFKIHDGEMCIESVSCVDYINGLLCGSKIVSFTTENFDSYVSDSDVMYDSVDSYVSLSDDSY